MKNLAIIPARGGSKRIKNKNIKSFLGKPIIEYSIEAALSSNLFDEVMVSTDSSKIKDISKIAGAKVPFIRSKENSNDYATLTDVIIEVYNDYISKGIEIHSICCILPTAPFVSDKLLREVYNEFLSKNLDSCFPIVKYNYPIERSFIQSEGKLKLSFPKHLKSRSQDLPTRFHDAGMFYWVNPNSLLKGAQIFNSNCNGIEIDEMIAQDIDNIDDWRKAEIKFKLLNA
ncbi:MAG: pseudaminic acid cytidylyltransferase [Flavobacteriales bacterium]|nr:pseudaminic acid cytidylyltransferase [Flavobacteriales bacterium]MBO73358.1 pseudaminic acid cytidylyltransferase [Flavobacteriales bacterium]